MAPRDRILRNILISAVLGAFGFLAIGMAIGFYARLPIAMWPVQWLGTSFWLGPVTFAHDFVLNTLLSLPVAIGLCLLAPRRLWSYAAAAVFPVLIWWNWPWLGHPEFSDSWPGVVRGCFIHIGSLGVALFLIRGSVGGNPPNKSLQRTLDPAAPSADAENASASSAAELRC